MKPLQMLMIFLTFFTLSACHLTRGTSGTAEALLANLLRVSDVAIATITGTTGTMTGTATTTAPTLNYIGSPYTFTQNTAITPITPTTTGTITSCTASPSLPTGLSINSTNCVISGTPTVAQIPSDYTITVSSSGGSKSSSIQIAVFGLPPFKSNQIICYSGNSGTSISCTNTGQEGEYQPGTPQNYTGPTTNTGYINDYITKDNVTGLTWKTCPEGQSGSSCIGTLTSMNWSNASTNSINGCPSLNSANSGLGYAGITNWRMPTYDELQSIIYFDRSPARNSSVFPGIPGTWYWASTYVQDTTKAWVISFSNGYVGNTIKTGSSNLRCVSGSFAKSNLFIDNGNGTLIDYATKLVWQKCTNGQNALNCSGSAIQYDWSTAINSCKTLNLAGRIWRLPTVFELSSIVDKSIISSPVIDTVKFPLTQNSSYWTSIYDFLTPASAWRINFTDGFMDSTAKTNTNYVRCVSTGP